MRNPSKQNLWYAICLHFKHVAHLPYFRDDYTLPLFFLFQGFNLVRPEDAHWYPLWIPHLFHINFGFLPPFRTVFRWTCPYLAGLLFLGFDFQMFWKHPGLSPILFHKLYVLFFFIKSVHLVLQI